MKNKVGDNVNTRALNILRELYGKNMSQRELSKKLAYSLGCINKNIKLLIENDYIDKEKRVTEKGLALIRKNKPKNAIILAAGYGMRMVPINHLVPKGLLEVHKECLIERIIKQLHEVGIYEIYIVVGFMKESYDYLVDKYGVKLLFNPDYTDKNNLYSLNRAIDKLGNSYIVPCDIWCLKNPFHREELYSWYMVSDALVKNNPISVNKNLEIMKEKGIGNKMVGIAYLTVDKSEIVKKLLKEKQKEENNENIFWEEAAFLNKKMIFSANCVDESQVVEINTYEELRELDANSNYLQNEAVTIIKEALKVQDNDIKDIKTLKKGMTNRSFLFTCKGIQYIMRIPGEGTDLLINRRQEGEVYQAIQDIKISDEVCYFNPKNGYKITKFISGARVCDANNIEDVTKCIHLLKEFHQKKIKVNHTFDLFKQINFYEELRGRSSIYKDYDETKTNIFSLKLYIEKNASPYVLTHIDANPDNFLIYGKNDEKVALIDWEYASMQDPHVDIAMFAIYSSYDKEQIDKLIQLYFGEMDEESYFYMYIKIYCYIAICGLLWSNWCEYKLKFGIEFGEYNLRQYRYAKDYYKIVKSMLEGKNV